MLSSRAGHLFFVSVFLNFRFLMSAQTFISCYTYVQFCMVHTYKYMHIFPIYYFSLIGSLFMVTFLHPETWSLYAGSALLGAGAALIWTGQGIYLSRCSTSTNISRNSGIFWAMLQTRYTKFKRDLSYIYFICL